MSDEIKLVLEHDKDNENFEQNQDQFSYVENIKTRFNENAYSESIQVKEQIFSWCRLDVFSQEHYNSGLKSQFKSLVGIEEKPIKPKHILKNMCGTAYPGELLVIMGSSGAGKTTLLNCMTFRNLKTLTVTGTICLNNCPVNQTQLASRSAYIQQDDMFIGYLTVKEHLIFQAHVRINSGLTHDDRLKRVEEVMKELALKKCENCVIGVPGIVKGISGGERKRLALASEFLTNPSILFCDEPTTGLDSFMALSVIQMLRDIARTGRTVIATVHQPSSEIYQMFDKLCLVAEGRTAFLGTTKQAENFFDKLQAPCPRNFNPADYYIQVLSVIPGEEKACRAAVNSICDAFQSSKLGIKITKTVDKIMKSCKGVDDVWSDNLTKTTHYKVGFNTQIQALLWRSWLAIAKNPTVTKARFITVFAEAVFIVLIYFGQTVNQLGIMNLDGVFFYFLLSNSYQNVFATINTFAVELPLLFKEYKDGLYRIDVYYLSKIICDIPISVFMSWLKTTMIYFAVGLNPEIERFLTAVFISILVGLAAQGIGLIISCITPSLMLAPSLTSVFVTPMLLVGGIYLNIRSIPIYLEWISNFSWIKFGFEAYMINQWSGIRHIPCDTNSTAMNICINNGVQVLHRESIKMSDFWPAILALIGLILLFRLVAFLILFYRARSRD